MARLATSLDFLGGIQCLIAANDRLNAAVVERIIETQELVMLNNFAIESSEFQFKNSLHSRIAEIESWRYVLKDLIERLKKAKGYLQHEHKALSVVVKRIDKEIEKNSTGITFPGELICNVDIVELAIFEEQRFLKKEKTKFEALIQDLEKHIKLMENTRKSIENDVFNKEKTVNVEEECAKEDRNSEKNIIIPKKKRKKKYSSYDRWESRCKLLKEKGLQELSKTVIIRQQLRGARIELTIKSQAYSSRVDAVLRRRLHANQVRLQELAWQRDEATRDHKTLEEELLTTQKTIVENIDQQRVVEMRIIERNKIPAKERVRDDVDRKLKEEMARLRRFINDLRDNLRRIRLLQQALVLVIYKIDNAGADIHQVIRLDEERIRNRILDEEPAMMKQTALCNSDKEPTLKQQTASLKPKEKLVENSGDDRKLRFEKGSRVSELQQSPRQELCMFQLETIAEEKEDACDITEGDECDDYPFDF